MSSPILLILAAFLRVSSSFDDSNRTITEGSGETIFDEDVLLNNTTVTPKIVSKRAVKVFYNGQVDFEFFSSFTFSAPRIPPTAVVALGRPLQRGETKIPQTNFIILWTPRGEQPHWGALYSDGNKLDGYFIKDKKLISISSKEMANVRLKLLQYVGTSVENNFRLNWVKAKEVDVNTVVAEKQYGNLCSPRMAPAIFQAHGNEFLGEADIDNRQMFYASDGHVFTVGGTEYTNNVLLLVKDRCQCSCQ